MSRTILRAATFGVHVLFNTTIVVEDAAVEALLDEALTRDVLPTLETMTGQAFSVINESAQRGVIRVRINESLAAQRYTVTGTISTDLVIEGGSWRGCKLGLYAWLAELGVQQLAPGDRWRVLPARSDLRLPLSVDRTPAIATVAWTAQGAPSGNVWPFGDGIEHIDAWYEFLDWSQRPIGHYTTVAQPPERVPFGGHVDPFVYGDKQAEFDADPTHFAQLTAGDPTRVVAAGIFHNTHDGTATGTTYSGTGGVIGIYADWIGDQADANAAGLGAHPELAGLQMVIGAAVADGAGFCKDDKCIDLIRNEFGGSTDANGADRELWRAGRVYDIAKATRPTISFKPQCYAYDRQSAPPTDGHVINENILVTLANWVYATDGYPGSVLLDRWAAKRDAYGFDLSAYDYWALTEHTASDARFSTTRAWRHFRQYLDANVVGFFGESTFAVGSVGPQWWGALRLTWDGTLTDDELLTEWCASAFGAGAPHVQRMLERWWLKEWPFMVPHGYELGLAFDDLRQADLEVVGVATARSRVAAMMAYVVWLHHRFQWFDVSVFGDPTEEEADAVAGPLLTWIWRTRTTLMVDAKYFHDQVFVSGDLSSAFETQWAIPVSDVDWPTWQAANGLVEYTDEEIRTAFEALRTGTYPVPAVAVHTTAIETSLTVPLTPTGTTPVQTNWVYGNEAGETGHEYIFATANGGTLTVRASASSSPAAVRIRLYNAETGAHVSTTDVNLPLSTETDHNIDLTALPSGFYRMFVENHRGEVGHSLLVRPDTAIVRVGAYGRILWNAGDTPTFPRYFFVPRNVESFHVFTTNPDNFALFDGEDDPVTPTETSPYVFRFDVPVGQDHAIWRAEGVWAGGSYPGHGTPRILDIPEWAAPTREQIIVPANLWAEAT